jgi:hypothetical protein
MLLPSLSIWSYYGCAIGAANELGVPLTCVIMSSGFIGGTIGGNVLPGGTATVVRFDL